MNRLTVVVFVVVLSFVLSCVGTSGQRATGSTSADTDETPADSKGASGDLPAADDAKAPSDSGKESPDLKDPVVPKDIPAPPENDVKGPPKDPPPIVKEVTTFIGDWDIKPGKEITKCVVKRLGNADVMWVQGIKTKLNNGSHHLIVYKSDEKTEKTTPFECTPFVETIASSTVPLMISQIANETLMFPPGVAIKFEPNQMIRMEAHYLNYFTEDITAHADVTFMTIAAEDVVDEANLIFHGTPDFKIPPGKESKTDWFFAELEKGTKVFALTGHTHKLGTNVEVYLSDGPDDPGTPVYPGDQEFKWDEAPVVQYQPAMEFDGKRGMRYRCTWFNDTNKTAEFGESADKEMCFFWAYYYPSKGYRLCVNPGSYKSLAPGLLKDQECCPGSAICGLLKQFLKDGLP